MDERKTTRDGGGTGETLLVGGLLLAFAALAAAFLYIALA